MATDAGRRDGSRRRATAGRVVKRALLGSILLYVLLLHGIVAAALVKSDLSQRVLLKLGLVGQAEFDSQFARSTEFLVNKDRGAVPGSVVFLGDSQMRDIDAHYGIDELVNLAASNDTALRLLARMPRLRSIGEARAIVLGVGINDLKYREPPQVVAGIERVLDLVPADTPVVLKSVLPTDEDTQSLFDNDTIIGLNKLLAQMCGSRPSCHYLDLWPTFVGEDGNLLHHRGDGLHLDRAGRAMMTQAIIARLDDVLGDAMTASAPVRQQAARPTH